MISLGAVPMCLIVFPLNCKGPLGGADGVGVGVLVGVGVGFGGWL